MYLYLEKYPRLIKQWPLLFFFSAFLRVDNMSTCHFLYLGNNFLRKCLMPQQILSIFVRRFQSLSVATDLPSTPTNTPTYANPRSTGKDAELETPSQVWLFFDHLGHCQDGRTNKKGGKSLTSGYTFLFHKYILPKSINIHLASVPVKQKIHGNLLGRYRKFPSINYEPGGLRRLCARRVVFLSLFLPVCWSLIGFSYNTLLFERILSFLTKCSFLKETCQ